jgi:hypothetical protein
MPISEVFEQELGVGGVISRLVRFIVSFQHTLQSLSK